MSRCHVRCRPRPRGPRSPGRRAGHRRPRAEFRV